jgi:hypothetical protein
MASTLASFPASLLASLAASQFSSFPTCFVGFFFVAMAWISRSFLNYNVSTT